VRRLDESAIYPAAGAFAGDAGWAEGLGAYELADAPRSTLREGYADAGDEEVDDALADVLDSMSPAEAFNFASTLQVTRGRGSGSVETAAGRAGSRWRPRDRSDRSGRLAWDRDS
jgi:hypothetical protein